MCNQHLLAWALSCYASLDMLVMMYFCCNFNFLWCVWSVSSWPCCKFELSQIPCGSDNGFVAVGGFKCRGLSAPCIMVCCLSCGSLGLYVLLWQVSCPFSVKFPQMQNVFLGFVFSWYIFTIFANKHLARKKNESRFVCSMLC